MNPEVEQLALEGFKSGIYKKNIHYLYHGNIDPEQFLVTKMLGASPAMSGMLIQHTYARTGIQMQISKGVSSDLLASDFNKAASMENIPMPSLCMEMYFEDPLLPTILFMKGRVNEIQKLFPDVDIELEETEYITALMQEGTGIEGKQLSLQLRPEMYADFLQEAKCPNMNTGMLSSSLSSQDNAAICFMLHLALKVLVFASIPYFKPVPLSRKQMHWGGKPGVQGRPERRAFKIEYLPKVICTPTKTMETTSEHEFLGRRGFIRWYKHERFVNMQGKWDYIKPVPNPKTGKYPERGIIVVRKPIVT